MNVTSFEKMMLNLLRKTYLILKPINTACFGNNKIILIPQ